MSKIYAAITGVQGYLPDYVLTNAELEKMVDTNDEWITTRTGIKERRLLKGEGLATSDMVAPAILGLLEKTNTRPEEVDLLIVATVTPDMMFPDTANVSCHKAGLTNAWGFDLHAACSGFLFALQTAARFIASGTHKKVIVAGADKMSAIVDYTDRSTCIIFGDACAAVMLEPDTENGVIDAVLKGDGSGKDLLHMKAGGSLMPASRETVDKNLHVLYQEGRHVFKYAVRGMSDSVMEVMRRNGLSADDINWVVPHQANKRIIESVASAMNFPMERVMMNIQRYGNTTAATIPLCLWDWESQLKKGDQLVLTAFGGGFTWGAIYVRWAYDGSAR